MCALARPLGGAGISNTSEETDTPLHVGLPFPAVGA